MALEHAGTSVYWADCKELLSIILIELDYLMNAHMWHKTQVCEAQNIVPKLKPALLVFEKKQKNPVYSNKVHVYSVQTTYF